MTAGALTNLRFNPCRLVIGPTQNPSGNSYPFGGTEIGLVQALAVSQTHTAAAEVWEEYAQIEGVHGIVRRRVRVACSLRNWDAAAIDALPQGTSAGLIDVVLTDYIDGTALAGVKLLAVPDQVALGNETVADCEDVATALYDAVYLPDEASKAELGYGKQYGRPVVFLARPQVTTGRMIQQAKLRDITGFA